MSHFLSLLPFFDTGRWSGAARDRADRALQHPEELRDQMLHGRARLRFRASSAPQERMERVEYQPVSHHNQRAAFQLVDHIAQRLKAMDHFHLLRSDSLFPAAQGVLARQNLPIKCRFSGRKFSAQRVQRAFPHRQLFCPPGQRPLNRRLRFIPFPQGLLRCSMGGLHIRDLGLARDKGSFCRRHALRLGLIGSILLCRPAGLTRTVAQQTAGPADRLIIVVLHLPHRDIIGLCRAVRAPGITTCL